VSITIGIPFSGESKHLELAVRSVFAQTFEDWRLILVSDNAAPHSVELAQQIDDERVTLIDHRDGRGLAVRLNEIAALTATEFLARMDADDLMHPERLANQLRLMHDEPGLDVVGSHAVVINQEGLIMGEYREPALPHSRAGYLESNALTHPTVTARTSWFRRYPYDETFLRCQDKELWLRSSGDTRFSKDPNPLLFYRIDENLSVKKQALSSLYNRRSIRLHGPHIVGKRRTAAKIAKAYVKQSVFAVAVMAGQSGRIYRGKFDEMGHAQSRHADEAFSIAKSARVPGWE